MSRAAPSFVELLVLEERRLGKAARTGLRFVRANLLLKGRTPEDVVAIVVRGRQIRRRVYETLDDLEERANPGGSWRAIPMPVCDELDQALSLAAWEAALRLHDELHGPLGGAPAAWVSHA